MFVLMGSHIELEWFFQTACYNKVHFQSVNINPEIDFKAVSEHVDQKFLRRPTMVGDIVRHSTQATIVRTYRTPGPFHKCYKPHA